MVTSKLHLLLTTAVLVGLMTSPLYAMEGNDSVVVSSRKRKIENISDSNVCDKAQITSVQTTFKKMEEVHGTTYAKSSLEKAINAFKCNGEWTRYFRTIVSNPSRQINSSDKKQDWIDQLNKGISFIEQRLKESFVSYDESYITSAREGFDNLKFYSSDNHARESLQKVLQDFNDQKMTQEWKQYLRDIVLEPKRPINYQGKSAEWVRLVHQGMKHVNENFSQLTTQAQDKLKELGHLSNSSGPVQPQDGFDHWSFYKR